MADANDAAGTGAPAAGGPGVGEGEGEAQLLVSEFPPPPFYYTHANLLTPPAIPKSALERGTRRAAKAAAKAKAEAERIRLGQGEEKPSTDVILGGAANASSATAATSADDGNSNAELANNTNDVDDNDEDGSVVAVFGEIVEDPNLVQVVDICEDPTRIRDEVHRLNAKVVELFVGLVRDLVHDPLNNKQRRDELSHNVFLMLQECNKFREHQAREVLIELLEKQLMHRKEVLQELEMELDKANDLLPSL